MLEWLPLAATVASSLFGGSAAKSAANTQAAAADRATDLQREMWQKQLELQQPWQEAGVNALARMRSGDVMGAMDPSYKFRLGEGLKALDRQAAARGGLISGAALKAAGRYGQDFASQEYGNAYNRLAAMAGIGQTATNQLGANAGQYATGAGGLMTDAARARASGYMGSANALSQELGRYMQYSSNQDFLNAYKNRLAGGGSTGGYNWQQGPSIYSDPTQIPMQPGGGY